MILDGRDWLSSHFAAHERTTVLSMLRDDGDVGALIRTRDRKKPRPAITADRGFEASELNIAVRLIGGLLGAFHEHHRDAFGLGFLRHVGLNARALTDNHRNRI